MIAALAGLLLPVAAAWLALRATGLRSHPDNRLLTAVLSFAVGIGVSSQTTLLLLTLGVSIGARFVVIDALLWSLIILGCGIRLRRERARVSRAEPRVRTAARPLNTLDILVRCAFALVALTAAAALVMEYVRSPHGQWDAWAIWNQKARFLVRGGREWADMMDVSWSNPGHPMLVSTSVARLWAYAGREATVIPAGLAILFGAGIVAAVIAALDPHRQRAWIAGALVVAPTTFIHQIGAQTSDLPLSLYVLLTIVMMRSVALNLLPARERAHLFMAGLVVGIAAWTKNEGLVLFGIGTLLVFWWSVVARRVDRLASWLVAATPLVLIVVWYKVAVAPVAPEYMPRSEGVDTVAARVLNPDRPMAVLALSWHYWLAWGGQDATGVLPIVTLAAAVASFSPSGWRLRGLLLTLCLMFVSYCAVWLVAPFDPAWMISTTFDRLTIQLWPSLVVIAFALVDGPLPITSNR